VGVSAYWNDVENLIEAVSLGFVSTPEQLRELMDAEGIDSSFQPVPGRLLFLYKNVARARTRGVEVDGELRVLPSLQVAGAYTYLQARDLERDLDLTGRSPHQGAVRVAWTPLPGFSANLQGTIISSWIAARSTTATGVTDTAADGFSLWDVALSQRIARRVTLTAAVLNLGDSVDPNTGALSPTGTPLPIYRPEYGRVFRAGVRFDLGTR